MTTNPSVREIDCNTTVRRLWDYLDNELDATRLAEVDAHIEHCAACTEHFEFAKHFLSAVHDLWPDVSEPAALQARVRARLETEGFRVA